MPTLLRVPKYRLHKARGLAVVTLDGVNHYLGRHGSAESRRRYNAKIAEWTQKQSAAETQAATEAPALPTRCAPTIGELALKYLAHAAKYYVKNGVPTSQIHIERAAARAIVALYETELAKDFGPLKLDAVQQSLIGQDKARVYINELTASIKRMFRWGAKRELIPASVFHGIDKIVQGLRRGRTEARETDPILPVADGTVTNTLPHLSPVLQAMVKLQQLTGARPGEIVILRPIDVTMQTDGVWVYRPSCHKTEHHERERRIFIGPEGQEVLRPFMNRAGHAFCFSPREAEDKLNRKKNGRRRPGLKYSTAAYRRAIERACERAFGMPESLRKIPRTTPVEEKRRIEAVAAAWRKQYCWAPNQLRHSAATRIREQYGIEASQMVLGHSDPRMTTVYAERNFALAADVMRKHG